MTVSYVVQELEKENASLKSEVLKLQANREKDRYVLPPPVYSSIVSY